ncbi:uncharacterized protein [Clytia hemisphaerica]|uniref:Transmembrane protein n=1 Tax=Clytia hemisphaerica TaxID=252671 RepID=A0A7M5VCX0_9CNID
MRWFSNRNKIHPTEGDGENEEFFENESKNNETFKIAQDFKLFSSMVHLAIGFADVCFWWSVWLMSDSLYPINGMAYDGYAFLRGYCLILTANFVYFTIRWLFYETFTENYDNFSSISYPAIFLKYAKFIKEKSSKFKVLKLMLPLCVYGLVVGFIQIWRGLFDIFGYLLKLLERNYQINQVWSALALQFVVAVSLAFTRKNNAVNLCPTHEDYKKDELQYLDTLFNMQNLTFMKLSHRKKEQKWFALAERKFNLPALFKREKSLVSESIVDTDFDIVKYFTNKLISSLSTTQREPINGLWQIIVETEPKERECVEECHSLEKVNLAFTENENVFQSTTTTLTSLPTPLSTPPATPTPPSRPIPVIQINGEVGIEREKTVVWENRKSKVTVSFESEETSTIGADSEEDIKSIAVEQNEQQYLNLDQLNEEQKEYTKILTNISEKRFEKRAKSICINITPDIKLPKQCEEKETKEEMVDSFDWRHSVIEVFGYLYAIHHRQIFLHIFGGMFWSTTWKLFDFATESIFTKTASDIPGLVLIAIFCHSMNHLVLFRFKEMAPSIYLKTFYNFLCGVFTVCLWACAWYVLDITTTFTDQKRLLWVTANLVAFFVLAFFNISINIAL